MCACIRDWLLNGGVYSSGVRRIKVVVRHPGFGLCVCEPKLWSGVE